MTPEQISGDDKRPGVRKFLKRKTVRRTRRIKGELPPVKAYRGYTR